MQKEKNQAQRPEKSGAELPTLAFRTRAINFRLLAFCNCGILGFSSTFKATRCSQKEAPFGLWAAVERVAASSDVVRRRVWFSQSAVVDAYFLLEATWTAGPVWIAPEAVDWVALGLDCLGFFCSRLLRF